jgi:hypothetical protein
VRAGLGKFRFVSLPRRLLPLRDHKAGRACTLLHYDVLVSCRRSNFWTFLSRSWISVRE